MRIVFENMLLKHYIPSKNGRTVFKELLVKLGEEDFWHVDSFSELATIKIISWALEIEYFFPVPNFSYAKSQKL